jgi:hypothetical protein
MSVAGVLGAWVRGKAESVEVVVVERPVVLWERDESADPLTVDDLFEQAVAQMTINGYDEELAEFKRTYGK